MWLWFVVVERTSEVWVRLVWTFSDVEGVVGEVRALGSALVGLGVVVWFESVAVVFVYCFVLIDVVGFVCVVVKLQLVCFERFGAFGWLALEHVCAHVCENGLLVLVDGKCGDVSVIVVVYG